MSDSTNLECPFCHLESARVLDANELATTVADAFPVSRGHKLVIPRRHVADFFDLSVAEVAAVFELLFRARSHLATECGPAGFNVGVNVGVNVGAVGGQTIMHAHVHLIPRYPGDVPDPTGGIRNLMPGRGRYGQSAAG